MVDNAEEGFIEEMGGDEEIEASTELTTETEDRRFVKRFTIVPISFPQETTLTPSSEADGKKSKLRVKATPDKDEANTKDSIVTQLTTRWVLKDEIQEFVQIFVPEPESKVSTRAIEWRLRLNNMLQRLGRVPDTNWIQSAKHTGSHLGPGTLWEATICSKRIQPL